MDDFTKKERALLVQYHMLKNCYVCKTEVVLSMAAAEEMRVLCSKHISKGFGFD
jgi:hypothetical protein